MSRRHLRGRCRRCWAPSSSYASWLPQAAREAAALSWDASAPPLRLGPAVTVQAGRPDLDAVFGDLAEDRSAAPSGAKRSGGEAGHPGIRRGGSFERAFVAGVRN